MSVNARDLQRLSTRRALFDAAVAEMRRVGLAGADVSVIAAAAGVSRASFYKYFPTKEHVLVELKDQEEERICARLAAFRATPRSLAEVFHETVRLTLTMERRLGERISRELLATSFATGSPRPDQLAAQPLVEALAAAVAEGQAQGRVRPEADPVHAALFFLVGLYGLLATVRGLTRRRSGTLALFVEHHAQALRVHG
jgi:TetR/AcrR family transcriptional repressor of uid operon